MDSKDLQLGQPQVEHQRLGNWRLRSPAVQNVIGAVCQGLCPGIYVSIISLGAGAGPPDAAHFSSMANLIVYAVFSVSALLSGPVVNLLGPRMSLAFGSTGYAMYVGGLWWYSTHDTVGFPYFAAAYLGLTAGPLWVATSYISQAYATERNKSRYITVQYCLNTVGNLIGSTVAFASNFHRKTAGGVTTGVYITYICLHLLAGVLALCLIVDPRTVQRNDGTHIAIFTPPTVKHELIALCKGFMNLRVLCFVPAAVAMDFWQAATGSWNSQTFSLRSRGLNTFCFAWVKIGSILIFNLILSTKLVKSRRKRIGIVLVYNTFWLTAGWAGWIGWITKQGSTYFRKTTPALDFGTDTDKWGGAFAVFIFMGIMAPLMRNFVYYMAAIASNHPQTQAHFAAIIHAAPQWGQVMAFGIDAADAPYLRQGSIYLAVNLATIALAAFGVWKYATDSLWGQEDNVIVPIKEAQTLGIDPIDGEPVVHKNEKDLETAVQVRAV